MKPLIAAAVIAGLCTLGSWRVWAGMEPRFRASLRGAVVRLLLLLLTLMTLALLAHLGFGYFLWRRLPPAAVHQVAGALSAVSLLPVTALLLGRGWLRVLPALGALAVAFVWSVIVAGLTLGRALGS